MQHALGKVESKIIERNALTEKFLSLLGLEKQEFKGKALVINLGKKVDYEFDLNFSFEANEETLKTFQELASIINEKYKIGVAEIHHHLPCIYKKSSQLLIKENGAITASNQWATIHFDQIDSNYYMEIIIESHGGAGHIRFGMANPSHDFESYVGVDGNSLCIYPGNIISGFTYFQATNKSNWDKGDKIGFYYEKNNNKGFYFLNGNQIAQIDNIPQNFFPALTVHCPSDVCFINKNAVIPNGKDQCQIVFFEN